MKFFLTIILIVSFFCIAFNKRNTTAYFNLYTTAIVDFKQQQTVLATTIANATIITEKSIIEIKQKIKESRLKLKNIDFWLRYFEPIAYKKINGPLPIEWENEVFEKFEPPYKREGAGLTLAELYLEEKRVNKDTLLLLIEKSLDGIKTFEADSITNQLKAPHHFFLANRLYLLNLAAIYTTGFECPDSSKVIPELISLLNYTNKIYENFNASFPATKLAAQYIALYNKTISFVTEQAVNYSSFDHFTFIKTYVNPLFVLNQKYINDYNIRSVNNNDYTLTNTATSIFDKSLYSPQNIKGIYSFVTDEKQLSEIKQIGKLLFYDPILSSNNARSCASCHKPTQYFTDTTVKTAFQFNKQQQLPRNTPTLVNAIYNHLLMLDGKHISLQAQGRDVITNAIEMGSSEEATLKKILSCKTYKQTFKRLLPLTPQENKITLEHVIAAITLYYAGFSNAYAPFDDMINNKASTITEVKNGFNLFMSKAQCGTCHFVPIFNGVKPPYIGAEFEVLGVPETNNFSALSPDKGRFITNPVAEMVNAFRTGTLRNAQYTKPYMHNGVFNTLEEVVDFYDAGGGVGKGLSLGNQTLSSDSLKLSTLEKKAIIRFMQSLNEAVPFELPPAALPLSNIKALNKRVVGGEY